MAAVWLAPTCTACKKEPLQMAVCTCVVGDMADIEFRQHRVIPLSAKLNGISESYGAWLLYG